MAAPSEFRRLHLLVEGRVQGIGFRFTTVEIASGFPVTGFVRNLPHGDVEIVVEGPVDAVSDLLSAIQRSRLFRYVIRQHTLWSAATGEFRDFSIRYV